MVGKVQRTAPQPTSHAKSAKDAKEQPGKQREETGKGRASRDLFPGCGFAFPEFAWATKDAKGAKGEQERRGRITGARGGLGREKGEWRARRRGARAGGGWDAGGGRKVVRMAGGQPKREANCAGMFACRSFTIAMKCARDAILARYSAGKQPMLALGTTTPTWRVSISRNWWMVSPGWVVKRYLKSARSASFAT